MYTHNLLKLPMKIWRNTVLKLSSLSVRADPDFSPIPVPTKFTLVSICRDIIFSSMRQTVALLFSVLQPINKPYRFLQRGTQHKQKITQTKHYWNIRLYYLEISKKERFIDFPRAAVIGDAPSLKNRKWSIRVFINVRVLMNWNDNDLNLAHQYKFLIVKHFVSVPF